MQPSPNVVAPSTGERLPPRWQPISPLDRRVLGVLAEKAKTTPDAYPMSLNAIRAGANQKNNRDPVMELSDEQIQEALDRLRGLSVVAEVHSGGRVARYRHYLYEWLGVDKVELAVMTELLLRGAQSEGELRGRVARMEPIADLTALRGVVASLQTKGLVVSLTPEGRGHMLTHALYPDAELLRVRADAQRQYKAIGQSPGATPVTATRPAAPLSQRADESGDASDLRRQVAELQQQLRELRETLADLQTRCDRQESALEELRAALGG